jgi:hypothetical protein
VARVYALDEEEIELPQFLTMKDNLRVKAKAVLS